MSDKTSIEWTCGDDGSLVTWDGLLWRVVDAATRTDPADCDTANTPTE